MDRRQNSEQWNQMLEDALNSILNPSNSSNSSNTTTTTVTTDISNNNNTSSTENVENTVETSASSTTATATATTTTPTTTTPAPRTTLAQINTNAFATASPSLLNNHIRPPMTNSPTSTVDSTTSLYNDDELINKFTSDWFDCMYRYHMNVRQYHQNMNQFNRLSSNIYNDLANQRRTRRINSLMESIHRNHSSPVLNTPTVDGADPSTTSPGTTFSFPLNNSSTVPLFTNMPISLQELLARTHPGQQIEIQGFTIPVMDGYEPASTARFPTIAQIFEATEIFTYNDDSSSRVTDTRCPITLDDFEYGEELCEIKHCHHVFKWSSLRTWFSQNTHCPVCRHDIIEVDARA
jgi:hypothetical protein